MGKEQLSSTTENETEKIQMLKKLEKAKSTQERTKLFGKIMDTYWVDAAVWLIPELGDAGSSIVSSLYLLSEAKKMWLSVGECMKIVGYQTADALVWAVPIIWDIADYFFKANKRSANIFTKHFEKLKKEALKKWITLEEVAKIEQNNGKFIQMMDKHLEQQKKLQQAQKIVKKVTA